MKLLVYGAGNCGSLFAVRLHEAGHDVSLLARGERLTALRQHGVLLAEGDSPTIRRVPVPVVERPAVLPASTGTIVTGAKATAPIATDSATHP